MDVDNSLFCVICYDKDKTQKIKLVERHDTLFCPNCKTVVILTHKSPLGRYQEMWKDHSEKIHPLLRPDMQTGELPNTRLFYLYEDCYFNMLIGRYNAAIVLMGVLLEALMKERIYLKLGIEFREPYGACLKKIEEERLMNVRDIRFLRDFKNKIRNLYQHSDEKEILAGLYIKIWPIKIWPIQFKGDLTIEKLNKAYEKVKTGEFKPVWVPAWQFPAFVSVVKQERDKRRAVPLFNEVYDFVRAALLIYIKQNEYDEHNKKFGNELANLDYLIIE